MRSELENVKKKIDELLEADGFPDAIQPAYLKDAVRRYPCRGGKRLRPALVMWSCGLFGGDLDNALYAAGAVEVYHNWTLVHDDIIDNDDYRRGEATTHTILKEHAQKTLNFDSGANTPYKYGCDFAILAGDIQQGWAANLLLKSADNGVDPMVVMSLSRRLQEFVNRDLISGEALDVEFPHRNWSDLDEAEIENMLYLKTGVLLQYCAEAGAAIALGVSDLDDARIKTIGEFAASAGVAFQFRDDWLGVFGDVATFGKPVCSDVTEGKPTVLLVTALRQLSHQDRERLLSFVGQIDLSDEDIEEIRDLIRSSGAEQVVAQKADALVERSRELLAQCPDNKYRDLLGAWLDYLVVRNV